MKRIALLVIVALLVAGCGGDSGDAESDAPAGTDAAPTTQPAETDEDDSNGDEAPVTTAAPADDESTDDAPDVADFTGEGQATVTIDGETYYFGDAGFPAIQCMPDFFGVMIGALQRVDESGAEIAGGGSLQFALLRPGTDPDVVDQLNELSFDLSDLEQEWVANEEHIVDFELEPGTSQVDSVDFDGNSASGTATVYERNSYYAVLGGTVEEVAVGQATFEVTCADD